MKEEYRRAYQLHRLLNEYSEIEQYSEINSKLLEWKIIEIEQELEKNPCKKPARGSFLCRDNHCSYLDWLWLWDRFPAYMAWDIEKAFKSGKLNDRLRKRIKEYFNRTAQVVD